MLTTTDGGKASRLSSCFGFRWISTAVVLSCTIKGSFTCFGVAAQSSGALAMVAAFDRTRHH